MYPVVEKIPPAVPAIYELPDDGALSRLHRFTGQPSDSLLVMGARRPAPVDATLANSNDAITICTAVGFRHESIQSYIESAVLLQPDIFIAPADIVYAKTKSNKRIEKMGDRSERWTKQIFNYIEDSQQAVSSTSDNSTAPYPTVFAPILPVPYDQQRMYVLDLLDYRSLFSGLAVYDPVALHGLHADLDPLPRLSLFPPTSPHFILDHISQGIDIFTIPFLTSASDAGLALTFTFPPPPASSSLSPSPLAIDMFPSTHATSLEPLSPGCSCHACSTSTRAYIQHLLSAKEMLGWVFLQMHNLSILDAFFAGVRSSIQAGTFDADVASFKQHYVPELPGQTGQGPRIRGYQYKSEGPNEQKKNKPAFRSGLGNAVVQPVENEPGAEVVESAKELEEHGLGKQVGSDS